MLESDNPADATTLAAKPACGGSTIERAVPVLGFWGWSLLSGLVLVTTVCLVSLEVNLVWAIARRLADFAR